MSSSTLKVGIIGLPNVGKSTLFNAILGRQQALTAPYPFATVEPNVGVVDVPDERLVKLRDSMFPVSGMILKGYSLKDHPSLEQPPLVFATATFVDIAGLVKGAAKGLGLGNQFLGHIRDVDLILHVLRDFDAGIPRPQDSKDPEHDAEIVRTELELKDLEIREKMEKRDTGKKEKREQRDQKGEGKTQKGEGKTLAEKPVIYAVNVSEDKLEAIVNKGLALPQPACPLRRSSSEASRRGRQGQAFSGKRVFYFCAKIEEEISKMPKNEQKDYLKIYGLESSCLDRIISECFQALGLMSFFTAPASAKAPAFADLRFAEGFGKARASAGKSARQGAKWEIRAWPVRRDSPAPRAAGVIHSDFERLFIRAEVIGWEKLTACGSWQVAKEKGWVRTEGRDYLVKDGEVCNFLIGK